ncbi:hypothetical protein SXBG_00198 [Synechococcus phage S-CAM1]|jgi:hypothetical protein|uniref:Uncharacterized protein n=1 Tax=Synechococcus phage S-CAM1 TaxID=754037 RepID=M4QFD1_9CAUD|nr:hypothetical protein SXBG_00198 [Synechococcus phage S-CAM1]AGH26933.1 hypothetical protein SXBG_00198 [Synechococcus phage S-CAM1]AOV57389.1 hypothetical protein N330309_134 [Synechococcus phage S-CAM1]AOV57639.1 hypothetical protein N170310_134 [Synechococcus phage S-CAM1]AOV58139.1 hypothetical protein S170810_134 [Synechococcus phage S-CAM1]AOV58389.1 hypothetical protein C290910_134 [Synechococcus phage S-CAM1]
MNLLLRPLENPNDPVWSVIISIIILLIGVGYIIYYILGIDTQESHARGRGMAMHHDYEHRGSQGDV